MKTIKDLLYQDLAKANLSNWDKTKRRWARQLGKIPSNTEIIKAYHSLLTEQKIEPNKALETSLRVRKVRTLSGVAPFAVMMKPWPCPGNCIYCPNEAGMPKSYMSDEPAAARAKNLQFDPKLQVQTRIKQMEAIGHKPQKIQIIVIGATFSAYPNVYKKQFIKAIFDACNGQTAKTLEQAQKLNETATYRIVGMSVETRPDWINKKEVVLLRKLGVTKVQLGVQSLDETVLKTIGRGHDVLAVRKATKLLRDGGFKICYHLMPNLPGSNPRLDVRVAKQIFTDSDFRPDTVKIYPCIVVPGTRLYELWQQGNYQSYDDKILAKTLIEIKKLVPKYCRIDRLVRDITTSWTASGTKKTNMRQLIAEEMKKQNISCQCIRCREIKDQVHETSKPDLLVLPIKISGASEYFLSFESKDHLFALLRLRLPNKNELSKYFSVLEDAAIIREVQVFGEQIEFSKHEKQATQHKHYGRKLIAQAEKIAKEHGFSKIAIISGVGVRTYYERLGYKLEQTYMVKKN
ncbi:tRNA uridine(34) 5-carboxymethylaminomethyl modification radical SAM/GNAT enzyme Elp3 [Candidatus Beckwithbacteria bacterium]|nr:tRNA uridine(34) 5-carboxymethylaminomethyl modification radical SAM/GNAT enzyme Elp3 [Candidatus Beckwithbacteria bacterium]